MKRLLTILLIVLVAFAVVATVISSRQKAAETPAPEAPAAEPAEPADTPEASAEPVVIRSLDLDAIRALHNPDEVGSLDDIQNCIDLLAEFFAACSEGMDLKPF